MPSANLHRKLLLLAVVLANYMSSNSPEPDNEAAHIQGNVVRYGQWVLGCSNQRVCVAAAALRKKHASDSPAHMRIVFQVDIADPQSIAIARNGEQIEALSPRAVHLLTKELRKPFLSDAIYQSDEAKRYAVPRDGFAGVMKVLTKWRAMTPQQLPPSDIVTPFPAELIDDPGVPPMLANVAKRCPKGHMGQSLQAWRGAGGAMLWRAGCGNEGLNSISFWFTTQPKGGSPESVMFVDGDDVVTPYNSWFQDSSGYLRMTHYFGEYEDCGVYRAYFWGPRGMKPVETRVMPFCGTGIGPKDWIETYKTVVLNGPDSGP